MTNQEDIKAAKEYGENHRILTGQFVGTAERLGMAFLAGCAHVRAEMDRDKEINRLLANKNADLNALLDVAVKYLESRCAGIFCRPDKGSKCGPCEVVAKIKEERGGS